MAFFRFSRDKRGYEHFYLVEPVTNRKGKSRPRVLYWYRTPPNVRVGRVPFDDEVRRALEAQYPDVTFDWAKITSAPIPSADAEMWRERRKAERAERSTRRGAPIDTGDEELDSEEAPDGAASSEQRNETNDVAAPADVAGESAIAEPQSNETFDAPAEPPPAPGLPGTRRRRRRRRGRGDATSHEQGSSPAPALASVPDADVDPQGESAPDEPTEE